MIDRDQINKEELVDLCIKFFEDQDISCAEAIYQTDRVIENAYTFIEEIGNLIGYTGVDDEDD